jgi:hypothetical protein
MERATIESQARKILDSVSMPGLKTVATWKGEVSETEYEKCLPAAGIRVNSLDIVRQVLRKNPQLFHRE